ncbi:hypothetical protein Sjap_006433 [Stephania japonica]|uniref:Transmembrane protein n=1 Tax=Stephania japonica TaxID=461633 RepID=A0AAP0PLZ4_9MAGN
MEFSSNLKLVDTPHSPFVSLCLSFSFAFLLSPPIFLFSGMRLSRRVLSER